MKRNLRNWGVAGVLAAATLSGCQTWVPVAGLTLPSPHYLKHHPQYIPPSGPFPLPRELASMEAQSAAAGPVAPGQQPLGAGGAPPVPGQ
jgi:hypothetical protein